MILSWMDANMGTILVSLVLIGIVAGAIAVILKDKKKGVSACGGNCGHCPMSGSCHRH